MTPLQTLCDVCKARASGHGFGFRGRPLIHACSDPACIALLPKVYKMQKNELDVFEERAIREGGREAGKYLDQIDTYDLRTLTNPQWEAFLGTFERARQAALKRMIEKDEAPF